MYAYGIPLYLNIRNITQEERRRPFDQPSELGGIP